MNEESPQLLHHLPVPTPDPAIRLRSVPYRRPYLWAGLLALLNYCVLVAVFTTAVMLLLHPSGMAAKVLVGSVIGYFLTSVASLLKRRTILCPLCKGTPLVGSRAHVHSKAFRIFPFSHATSAMFSILFRQTFRCMYCGSRFDVLKPRPKKNRHVNEESD